MISKVRTSAKAVIIKDDKVLFTRNKDDEGAFYLLPGGGQEPGERILDALRRECIEEIGASVTPGKLLFVRDYIGCNHEFAEWDADFHQMELMFECTLEDGVVLSAGTLPDVHQDGIEWLPIADLARYRVYPRALIESLVHVESATFTTYLGDVN